MKRIASILLLCLLAFNWFGYRLLVSYMQQKADIRLEAKLDHNRYDESQLVEIKIPISLPYQSLQSDYERYDGQVEYNGTFYKYVKRKIAGDTLYIQCISNHGRANLETAKNDFFKNSNDISQSASGKQGHAKTGAFKNLLGEFDNYLYSFAPDNLAATKTIIGGTYQQVYFPRPSVKFRGQPPDVAA